MEIGRKGEMDIADKMTFLRSGRIAVNCAQSSIKALISSLLWLEAKYCNGNWHEEEGCNLTLLD